MAKQNFILLSMEDDKIKKVSNVISNESCRRILDYLSEKEATESELSEKLNLPLSNINYNMKQLVDTGLAESKEFHYSQKGKEVSHYRLANKYIIIAPKKTLGIKEKLKGILPAALIASGAAAVLQITSKYLSRAIVAEESMMIAKSAAESGIADSAMDAELMLSQAAPVVPQAASITQNIALWFLAGALFALAAYLLISMIRRDYK